MQDMAFLKKLALKKPQFPRSRSLSKYLKQSQQVVTPSITCSNIFFARSIGVRVPTVQPNRINRVLIFCGCFNPPHIGHLRLLEEAYFNGGNDLNIIAAIILPLPDATCGRKLEHGQPTFSRPQRIMLWRQALRERGYDCWCYVYDQKMTTWGPFLDQLRTLPARGGLVLRTPYLSGPDWVHLNKKPRNKEHREVITSDCTRMPSFLRETPWRLTDLQHWTPWVKLVVNNDDWEKKTFQAIRRRRQNDNPGQPGFI